MLRLALLIALLLGAGWFFIRTAVRAWRRPEHRLRRRSLVVVGSLFFLYWLVLPVVMAVVATRGSGGAAVELDLGAGTREVQMKTADGVELTATWVPPRSGEVVITYPSREWTGAESKMLARAGYGVLAVDMRGFGGSGGSHNSFGWGATPDIDSAVAWVQRETGLKTVGGFGSSVGGEQMIEAAASNDAIAAVVSEGAGERSIREMLLRGPAAALAIPMSLVQTASIALLTGESPPQALDDLASEISPRALMLIRAEDGHGGEELNSEYFAAAKDPKELWTVSGTHTGGLASEPAEFQRRVTRFFGENLAVSD